MTGTTDLFNIANRTPAVVAPTGSGAISGGVLRPGSIDQQAFQQMLRAQQSNRTAAGVGGKPVAMPVLPFQNGIPNLSSAQFAALVGDQTPEADDSDDGGAAADPQSATQQADPSYGTDLTKRLALGHALRLANPTLANASRKSSTQGNSPSGTPSAGSGGADPTASALLPRAAGQQLSGALPPPLQTAAAAMAISSADDAPSDDAPRIFRGTKGVQPFGQQSDTQTASTDAGASPDPSNLNLTDPTAPAAANPVVAPPAPPPSDPNLVHLKEQPDRDMQMKLRLENKRWVVDETPGSRQLFFGADGKFGWDDFLDVINPLQHIPIVSQIYRAITGDQINGAAEIIGALPLGPLGFLSMAGAIADVAVKSTTGKDIGDNIEAMVFGNDSGTTDNMAAKPGANAQDNDAAASTGDATLTQTASIEGQGVPPLGVGRYDIESARVRRG